MNLNKYIFSLERFLRPPLPPVLLSSPKQIWNRTKIIWSYKTYNFFQNDLCEGTGSIYGKSGVCYLKEECTRLEGTRDGPCASGFGVCCICKYKIL